MGKDRTTIRDVQIAAASIYTKGSVLQRWIVRSRPRICPFHVLAECIPQGASVLDVGCGAGLLLNVLTYRDQISHGVGFDSSLPAIEMARDAARKIGRDGRMVFWHLSVGERWPEGTFDVVSLVDVLHHVERKEQRSTLEQAAEKVAPGGMLLYKDMRPRPLWRAWANRLHDLVLARQWIHLVESGQLIQWMGEVGFALECHKNIDMLWYSHELLIFRRAGRADERGSR